METIWYVFKKFGGAPSFRHPSYESAVTEAQRLIDMVGGEYEILKLESVVRPAPKHVVEVAVARTHGGYYVVHDNDRVPF